VAEAEQVEAAAGEAAEVLAEVLAVEALLRSQAAT